MKDVTHLVDPGGVSAAKSKRVRGAYARCGLLLRDLPEPGARVTCPECAALEREDEIDLKRLQEV